MAQPIWITPAGSLGVIPEGVFFQTPLEAYDPDLADTVYYSVIAGNLPPGIQVSQTGLLTGIPKAVVTVQGVPSPVSEDVTNKFAVRAYTQRTVNGVTVINRLADRTFTLTVTGQDSPEFITPPGLIASYFDGTQVTDLQVEYTDTDPADTVVVRLVAGRLPPGLSINSQGLITGVTEPVPPINKQPGFSRLGQGFNKYPFDFTQQSISANYEFILEVSDGKTNGSSLRKFIIAIYSRDSCTADTTTFTADNTFVTADAVPTRTPLILTPTGSIGRVRSDNFFAFQFEAYDSETSQLTFVQGGDTIPGLTLDPTSGWLWGYIPDQGLNETTYDFTVRVYETNNPSITSEAYNYTITLVGAIDTEIIWLSDSNLGSINNGDVSIFEVHAVNASGIPLEYRLLSGSDSSLPQGLTLLPSGHIAGRVSFNTFALDGGATTFDVDSRDATITEPTTFDMTFTFTVEAYGQGNTQISVTKTFIITVVRAYNEPYENLYIQAMSPQNDRTLIQSLLQDQTIIPPDDLYRSDDPNFGRAQRVVYWHAYGLTSSTYADYISALYKNHYWKNLILGSIETAQAVDDSGNVIYEVVYSRVVDDLVNSAGESVSKDVVIPYPINPGDSTEIDVVYPNSLINMRDQVIDTVGKIADILPRWMLSKQSNGRVLGFTPSWVICFTQPGKSGQIAYNIKTQFGTDQLNKVDFEVDRYELDALLSKNWDPIADSTGGQWVPHPAQTTSFDLEYVYGVSTVNSGNDYNIGDTFTIDGGDLGGVSGTNDASLEVYSTKGEDTIIISESLGEFAIGDVVYSVPTDTVWNPYVEYAEDSLVVVGGQPLYYQAQRTVPAGEISNNIITAGSFVVGNVYTILTVGTTNFTTIGALSNTVGHTFVATGTGSGTGTAIESYIDYTNTYYWSAYTFEPTEGTITDITSDETTLTVERFNSVAFSGILTKTVQVAAGNFEIGKTYTIISVGGTDFTAVGASANLAGITFIATGIGTGGGIVSQTINATCDNVSSINGIIDSININGTANISAKGNTYSNIDPVADTSTGDGLVVTVKAPESTVFDGNSLKFIDPVDMYSNSQDYDKYLVFPKRNILE